jgi:probable Rubsico expression protein CbbX
MTQDSHVPFGMPRPSGLEVALAPEAVTKNGMLEPETIERHLAAGEGINVEAEARASGVFDVIEDLDRELVGLDPVKTRIREVAALLVVDMARRRFGLEAERPNLHMCFTGSPGTGKTTVAMRMATVLHRLGYLAKGHLVAVTRDELVGQYIGHTAPKTREVLKRAMGGVLFIDEAYYLHRQENERDYGQEAIEILLQVMENQRNDIVVRAVRQFRSRCFIPGRHVA